MGRPKGSVNQPGKRKKVKDPNKPKRPTSAYFYYAAAMREEDAKNGRSVTRVAEWTKEVSNKWKLLTDEEKSPFIEKAKVDKARFDSEKAKYHKKDEGKPKRPATAYFCFLADFRAKYKTKWDNKELIRQAGIAWNTLSATDKKPYEEQAEKKKRAYEEEMEKYRSGGATSAKRAKLEEPQEAKNGNEVDEDDEDDIDDEEEEEDDEEEDDE